MKEKQFIQNREIPLPGAGKPDRRDGQRNRLKKKGFPVGIFLVLFVVQSLLATGISGLYFVYAGRNRVQDIVTYTTDYSVALAGAFVGVAEMSQRHKRYSRLRRIFREKVSDNIVDEAFFVLKNGKLIAHSDKNVKKRLKGNLATDEFTYNLDLILRPAFKKTRRPQITDYNIIKKPVPFNRQYKKLLKRYIYSEIDSSGWLISRAVFKKKRAIGTVNLIISKERIFSVIQRHIDDSIRFLITALVTAFLLSFFIALVVLVRYRSIQRKALEAASYGATAPGTGPLSPVPAAIKAFPLEEEGPITIELLSAADEGTGLFGAIPLSRSVPVIKGEHEINANRVIKDAIKVKGGN